MEDNMAEHKPQYNKMSDEELVAIYHQGDNEAADYIVEKYKNLVRKKARAYYLSGGDNDDLLQEGMIGLYKAIRDYRSKEDTLFMTFASLCIARQIRSAVTMSNRKKNTPLNTYISLDTPVTDDYGDDAVLSDVIAAEDVLNPEELFIDKEQRTMLECELGSSLSRFETQVMELYVEGLSYNQIAGILNKTPKAVDNAIQRIKSKLNHIRL